MPVFMRDARHSSGRPGQRRPALPPFWRGALRAAADTRGALLMEAVVTVAVLTLVSSATLGGLSTAQDGRFTVQREATAENLALSQMDIALSLPYQPAPFEYTPMPAPAGYAITAQALAYPDAGPDIQRIVVTVSHGGTATVTLESLRSR